MSTANWWISIQGHAPSNLLSTHTGATVVVVDVAELEEVSVVVAIAPPLHTPHILGHLLRTGALPHCDVCSDPRPHRVRSMHATVVVVGAISAGCVVAVGTVVEAGNAVAVDACTFALHVFVALAYVQVADCRHCLFVRVSHTVVADAGGALDIKIMRANRKAVFLKRRRSPVLLCMLPPFPNCMAI